MGFREEGIEGLGFRDLGLRVDPEGGRFALQTAPVRRDGILCRAACRIRSTNMRHIFTAKTSTVFLRRPTFRANIFLLCFYRSLYLSIYLSIYLLICCS